MPIIKGKFQTQYVQVSNKTAQDNNLSFEARGLLVFMLSLPEDWVIHKSWLIDQTKAGRDKIQRMINELVKYGYLVKHQSHGDDGQFQNSDLHVYPDPITVDGLAVDGLAVDGKPATIKETSLEKKHLLEKKHKNPVQQAEPLPIFKTKACEEKAFKLIWSKYHKKEGKANAEKAFLKITSKLKTDEQIKEVTAHILNFNMYALGQLKKTNGKRYFGFDKKLLSTILNERQYNDFSAEEIYNLVNGA